MRILGIDPGVAIVGFGLIETERSAVRMLQYGAINTSAGLPLATRLVQIEQDLTQLIRQFQPDEIAIEELFFNTNITTGIKVAHARGVMLLNAIKRCGRLYEYTPLQIKQALTGNGRATKQQVQYMVRMVLKLAAPPKPDDAADALAAAICHANMSGSTRREVK